MTEPLKLLTARMDIPGMREIATAEKNGAYGALKKGISMGAEAVLGAMKEANLRGRGGAGFPAGVKWTFLPKVVDGAKYMVCNADESEPGTFKDRLIIEKDPHLLLEGLILGGFAVGATGCFLYIRGEMPEGAQILQKAIDEAYEKGFLGKNILDSGWDYDIWLYRGAGAYICGEETALMDSIEGKRGHPRIKPPFPAGYGVYGVPSNINNVETFANVPIIIDKGADFWKAIGPEKSPGPRLVGLCGHIKNPGVYELPMGIPLREAIEKFGGGTVTGRPIKAVIPGGSSVPVLTEDELDVAMDFDSMAAAGTMLGSGGVIVMDDTVCMVRALMNLEEFYAHESCGQCTPCREGVDWMMRILRRIENGKGQPDDLAQLSNLCDSIAGNTICPLGDAAVMPCESFLKKFKEEFEYHITEKRCMVDPKGMTTVFA